MAIQKSHPKSKSAKPRSSIFFLVASIACIGVLYLVSTLISAQGSIQNGVRRPRNRHTLHEKYLYWGSRIDCPGKHCDTCAGLGHQESSLRCALEEALFLGRTFVMPSRLCINPIHNKKGILHQSGNMDSEEGWAGNSCAMDSLYDLDLMYDTVPVILDNSKAWHHVLTTSMKLGSRGIAHVQGVSRTDLLQKKVYSNLLLINRTASPLAWFTECKDRNNRSSIMLPYSFLPSMATKKLRDAAEKGMALATLCAVAGLLGPVIEVVKLIAAPVRRQFSYLCCFSSNVDTLRDEARKLDDETRGVQMRVDAATNNAQLILPQVETWLTNSNEMRNETDGILDEALNVGNGCWKVGERYSLSRKAKKKSRAIKELLEWCNFSNVSHPPPIAATAPLASGTTTYEFDSRREIEGEIMKTLESKDVHKIGICGMGGVGKTTMVQMMMNRALKEGLFDEVVIAVVSQSVEKLKIQHLISFGNLQKLGLWRDTKSKNLWCDQIPFGFFRGLVELYIHDCSKIRRLFSSTSGIPQNLVNLHKLRIARCVEMVKVIEDEDVYPTKHSLFPSLQELELDCLPTLKCFCECDIELLSLTKLEIEWCNGMKDFISAGSLTAPALQTIRLNSRDMECIDDLTAALHKVFDENKCDLVRLAQLTAQTQALRPEDCHIL